MQRQVPRRPPAGAQARARRGRRRDPDEQQQGEGGGQRDRADTQPPRRRAGWRRVSGRHGPMRCGRSACGRSPQAAATRPAAAGGPRGRATRRGTAGRGAAGRASPRPETRWCSSQGTSTMRSPACSTSTVRPTSTPQPRASGLARVERGPAQAAHARQRLGRAPAGQPGDAVAGEPDDEAVPAAGGALRRQDGDASCRPCPAATGGTSTPRLAALASRSASTKSRCRGPVAAGSAWSCSPAIRRAGGHRRRLAPVAGVAGDHGAGGTGQLGRCRRCCRRRRRRRGRRRGGRRRRRRSRRCGPPRPWRGSTARDGPVRGRPSRGSAQRDLAAQQTRRGPAAPRRSAAPRPRARRRTGSASSATASS